MSISSAEISTQKVEAEVRDWRVPIISYLKDPGRGVERNIRRLAFKYILLTMSFIVEPPMMFFSSICVLIRLVLL